MVQYTLLQNPLTECLLMLQNQLDRN